VEHSRASEESTYRGVLGGGVFARLKSSGISDRGPFEGPHRHAACVKERRACEEKFRGKKGGVKKQNHVVNTPTAERPARTGRLFQASALKLALGPVKGFDVAENIGGIGPPRGSSLVRYLAIRPLLVG